MEFIECDAKQPAHSFQPLGVSVQFLNDFIRSCDRNRIKQYTTGEICTEFIKPRTAARQCSYCELVLLETKNNIDIPPLVGKATVFLSHCWQSSFLDVVDPLLCRLGSAGRTGAFVWFDLFSNPQHSTYSLPFEWWSNTFKAAIAGIGHTIITLNPWDNPVTLTRAWCCYELFCSVETNAKVEILMTTTDMESFTKALISDFAKVSGMIARVDIRTAEATQPTDKLSIFEAVEASPCGCDGVNTVIFEHITNWLCDRALDIVAYIWRSDASCCPELAACPELLSSRLAERGNETTQEIVKALSNVESGTSGDKAAVYVLFMCNAGRLLKDLGRLNEGHVVLESAVHYSSIHLPSDDRLILFCKSFLGEILLDMGRIEESDEILCEALTRQRNLLGACDADTLFTSAILGLLRLKQSRLSEAEGLIRDALVESRRLHGNENIKTQLYNSFLGSVCSAKGDLLGARLVFREVYESRVKMLGVSHPDTMSAANNWAHNMWKLGSREEALILFKKLLLAKQAKLGRGHPSTMSTMSNLAALCRDLGLLEEAEAMMRETIDLRKAVLGETHSSTLITISNLSGVLKDQGKFAEAEVLLKFALAVSTEKAGANHTNTLTYKSNLALVQAELGDFENAIVVLRDVLSTRRLQDGEMHVHTLLVMYRLGTLLSKGSMGNVTEAVQLLGECFQKRVLLLGASHADSQAASLALSQAIERASSEPHGALSQNLPLSDS